MQIREIVQICKNQLTKISRFNIFTKQGRRSVVNLFRNKALRKVEKFDISQLKRKQKGLEQREEFVTEIGFEVSPFSKYNCLENNPLVCGHGQQYLDKFPKGKYCPKCGFPSPLKINREIQGRQGTYRVEKLIGWRKQGRLYEAIKNEDYTIIIKEYLLPSKYFPSHDEIKQRQQTFTGVANFKLADSISRDFRLILPLEAINDLSEQKCYLITDERGGFVSIKNYLQHNPLMNEQQIIRLLDQVLQSLDFLHHQKLLLANGMLEEGIIHANISPESLLIRGKFPEFFVYLCDFGFWENLFDSSSYSPSTFNPVNDLVDLGYVCFYGLLGRKINDPSQLPNPNIDKKWQKIEINLRTFISKLVTGQFKTAREARENLRNLSLNKSKISNIQKPIQSTKKKSKKWLWWFLALAALLGFASLLYRILFSSPTLTFKQSPLVKYISNITNVPQGNFIYAIAKSKYNYIFNRYIEEANYNVGTGSYVFLGKGIIAENITLISYIQNQIQENSLTTFNYLKVDNKEDAQEAINNFQADFAIVSDQNQKATCDNAKQRNKNINNCTIAYDGIVVFVPFSTYDQSLHKALQGKITFSQLRDIYLGKITKWNELVENAPSIEIKLMIPEEPNAVEIFENKVLQKSFLIERFKTNIATGKIQAKDTLIQDKNQCNTINYMKASFNNAVGFNEDQENIVTESNICQTNDKNGAISFGILSKTFQNFPQCEVYPLALIPDNSDIPIQLIKTIDNSNINNALENCDKEKLRINQNLIRRGEYPLSFTLSILYPVTATENDIFDPRYHIGEKFAKIMMTEEAQCWLQEAQLIPLQPLKNCDHFF
jgi:ABC-type phosphate transport system substrate-binding protein/serine/threonine protein kinase